MAGSWGGGGGGGEFQPLNNPPPECDTGLGLVVLFRDRKIKMGRSDHLSCEWQCEYKLRPEVLVGVLALTPVPVVCVAQGFSPSLRKHSTTGGLRFADSGSWCLRTHSYSL